MAEPISTQVAIKAARSAWVDRAIFAALSLVVISSAVATKRLAAGPALAAIDRPAASKSSSSAHAIENPIPPPPDSTPDDPWRSLRAALPVSTITASAEHQSPPPADADIRYYDGRPIRPVKRMWMTVTAYSPDARSCGKWADGKTASMKSVWTNGGCLVAADTSILPIGSLVSVPGYAGDLVVPVLDRGGKIKGTRLDVLYPTHEVAMSWGVQRLSVTVWEFADE